MQYVVYLILSMVFLFAAAAMFFGYVLGRRHARSEMYEVCELAGGEISQVYVGEVRQSTVDAVGTALETVPMLLTNIFRQQASNAEGLKLFMDMLRDRDEYLLSRFSAAHKAQMDDLVSRFLVTHNN